MTTDEINKSFRGELDVHVDEYAEERSKNSVNQNTMYNMGYIQGLLYMAAVMVDAGFFPLELLNHAEAHWDDAYNKAQAAYTASKALPATP